MKKNIFKDAYRIKTGTRKTIYKAFGFKHLSDATNLYVHPNNQSFEGTTSLAQPIGEGLSLFLSMLSSIKNDPSGAAGGFFHKHERSMLVSLILPVPDEWRKDRIVKSKVHAYHVKAGESTIRYSAVDSEGKMLADGDSSFELYYGYLPSVAGAAAFLMKEDRNFDSLIMRHIDSPTPDTFAEIHETLYQSCKNKEFDIIYADPMVDPSEFENYFSFANICSIAIENDAAMKKISNSEISTFPKKEFDKKYLDCIPKLSSEFVLKPELKSLCNAIREGDSCAVLFHGPSGTGKTTDCKLICRELGLPVMSVINCTENLDEFVLGKYIPAGDRIEFHESDVTKAVRFGGAVIFEEINFAKPQYLAFLNSLLDDNGFIRLDNDEKVIRNRNFRFFATMNMGYYGTKELNQALFNRFNTIIETEELPDESINRMLVARVPESKAFADKMIAIYHRIKNLIKTEELEFVISPRNLENWARMARHEGYLRAAEKTLIPIARTDRPFEDSIRGILKTYKWS